MEDDSNVTSYKIEQRVALDGMWELVCEVVERQATVFDLNPFETYHFRVRAANSNGESKASNSRTGKKVLFSKLPHTSLSYPPSYYYWL